MINMNIYKYGIIFLTIQYIIKNTNMRQFDGKI